jgi:hypothetical protein
MKNDLIYIVRVCDPDSQAIVGVFSGDNAEKEALDYVEYLKIQAVKS